MRTTKTPRGKKPGTISQRTYATIPERKEVTPLAVEKTGFYVNEEGGRYEAWICSPNGKRLMASLGTEVTGDRLHMWKTCLAREWSALQESLS